MHPSFPFRAAFCLLTLALGLGGCDRPAPPARGFNLLLVSLDTLRADHLGVYGDAGAATPVLDELARAGARFEQVASVAPLTLPAHATLLSGLLPPHHGLRQNGLGRFPEELPTLATRLGAAGYRTGGFVGAFVLDRRFGLARGFDHYDDQIERAPGEPARLEAERRGDVVVDRALAWLRQPSEKPFFAWLHLYDAHAPYLPPAPFSERFAERPYAGEVAWVDTQLGRLLAGLAETGMAERTVVAVVGDHGEALGDHGERSHGLLLYEPALRVPWIVRAPGALASGQVVAAPVSLADVAPTLLGLLGLGDKETPAHAGRDLASALLARREPEPAAVYAETDYPGQFGWATLRALRRGGLKYVAAPRPELYDLAADPHESRNLFAERRREARDLAEALAEIRQGERTAGTAAPDAETLERLAALGYVGGVAPPRREGEGADPKDKVALHTAWEDAHNQLAAGHLDIAAQQLEGLVEADPDNPVFRAALAQTARKQGDFERAIVLYREAIAAAPGDADHWQALAATLREAGRPREALEAAKEALRLDSGRAEAHNLLGLIHLAQGDLAAARRELLAALALDPRSAAALNNLGNVERALGDAGAAETAYRRATELDPRWADPWNGLGTLLVEADRPREALAHFERALALEPGFDDARLNRAIALALAGERAQAAAALRELLERLGEDPRRAAERRDARQLLADLEE